MSIAAIDIGKLVAEERLKLIGDLWESLRAQPDAIHHSTQPGALA
ncbi:MAG: hypothetical protein Q7U89_04680 [Coriobacteriia bacterium]|nr:hypothetical protein [Coriobacteriia bacterium]